VKLLEGPPSGKNGYQKGKQNLIEAKKKRGTEMLFGERWEKHCEGGRLAKRR